MNKKTLAAAAVAGLAAFWPSAANAPAVGARRTLDEMAHAAAAVRDYTMTLITQEWDHGTLGPPQTLATKWARPFQVYYKRLCEPHKGREVLFSPDWNEGRLKVSLHTWPVKVSVNIDPHGTLAMEGTHHPVDETSMVYLVDAVLGNFAKADQNGDATVEDLGPETILGRPCDRIRLQARWSTTTRVLGPKETLWDVSRTADIPMAPLLHANAAMGWETPSDAKPGQKVTIPRYYGARVDLWIDQEMRLPLRAEIYDGNDAMFERFEHRDLKVNVGLRPIDFSPTNPQYKF